MKRKYTQSDFDEMATELEELKVKEALGPLSDEEKDRVKELRKVMRDEFGYQ